MIINEDELLNKLVTRLTPIVYEAVQAAMDEISGELFTWSNAMPAHEPPNTVNLVTDKDAPENISASPVDVEQINRLSKLKKGLSPKQMEVWKIFESRVEPVWADELKKAFPLLRKQGALPGVFRANMRWTKQLGGAYEDSPFAQIAYNPTRGGQYRGLTQGEVDELEKL